MEHIRSSPAMPAISLLPTYVRTMIPVLLLPMVSLAFLAAVVRALAASTHLGGSAHVATCASRHAMIFMMKLPMFLLVCLATVMRLFATAAALVVSHFPAQGTLYAQRTQRPPGGSGGTGVRGVKEPEVVGTGGTCKGRRAIGAFAIREDYLESYHWTVA